MSEEKLYYKEIEEKDGFITAKQAREMTNKVIEEFIKKDTLKKILRNGARMNYIRNKRTTKKRENASSLFFVNLIKKPLDYQGAF